MLLVNKDSLTPDVFPMVFRLSWRFGGSALCGLPPPRDSAVDRGPMF